VNASNVPLPQPPSSHVSVCTERTVFFCYPVSETGFENTRRNLRCRVLVYFRLVFWHVPNVRSLFCLRAGRFYRYRPVPDVFIAWSAWLCRSRRIEHDFVSNDGTARLNDGPISGLVSKTKLKNGNRSMAKPRWNDPSGYYTANVHTSVPVSGAIITDKRSDRS